MLILKTPHVVFKKANLRSSDNGTAIVVLRLPVGTKVNQALRDGEKLRANQAEVLAIYSIRKGTSHTSARAGYDSSFKYVVGKTVAPSWPFCRSAVVCASGIHFFTTEAEARKYQL